jgi:drug/metabolite transporter (DMT)-like permease
VLGYTGYYLLLVLSIRDAGSEVPTLIIGTIPLAVMLLGKPAGLRWRTLVPALGLTAAGLLLMMKATGGFDASAADGPHLARGLLLAVVAMASWTVFALWNAAWLKRNPEVDATDWTNWLGVASGLGGLALWWAAGSSVAEAAARPDRWWFVAVCVSTGFGAAWLATVLWTIASSRLPASLCGQLIVSETLFGLLYSFLWDGYWPTAMQAAACVLFVLGIVMSVRAHR